MRKFMPRALLRRSFQADLVKIFVADAPHGVYKQNVKKNDGTQTQHRQTVEAQAQAQTQNTDT